MYEADFNCKVLEQGTGNNKIYNVRLLHRKYVPESTTKIIQKRSVSDL